MNSPRGFAAAREYPLWDAIFGRRSRRVAAGSAFRSGTLSFQSKLDPQPLSRLEEAYLIAATGVTGLPYWDNPYETAGGKPLHEADRPRRILLRERAHRAECEANSERRHHAERTQSGAHRIRGWTSVATTDGE